MDFGGNQDKPNAEVNKELDLDGSKNNLILGLPTLDETPELSSRVSPLPLVKSLSTSAKKKLYYVMVPTEEARPKKKINDNIGEQNVVIKKRIKKQLQAYAGFLANITKD